MIPARGIFVVGVAAQRPLRDAGRVGERIEAKPLAAADVEPEDIRPGIHVHGEFSAYFRTAPSGREASSGPWGTEGLSWGSGETQGGSAPGRLRQSLGLGSA